MFFTNLFQFFAEIAVWILVTNTIKFFGDQFGVDTYIIADYVLWVGISYSLLISIKNYLQVIEFKELNN